MPKFSLKKKMLALIVITFAVIFFGVVTLFTLEVNDLNSYLHKDCTLPENICPFNQTVPSNSILGYTADALLFAFGVFLFFRKDDVLFPRNGFKRTRGPITAKKIQIDFSKLEPDEKKLVLLIQNEGAIFQSSLVEKSGFGKVKITRLLDRLESKGVVERKRRGMTNVVVLK